jgi:erythromycin esterase-like protein
MTYSFKRLWRMLVLSLIVGHPVGLHAQLPPEATARALKAAATRLTLEELEAARPIPALDSLVANARVVMLGEAWHGDGGAIRLRAAM